MYPYSRVIIVSVILAISTLASGAPIGENIKGVSVRKSVSVGRVRENEWIDLIDLVKKETECAKPKIPNTAKGFSNVR